MAWVWCGNRCAESSANRDNKCEGGWVKEMLCLCGMFEVDDMRGTHLCGEEAM